MESERSDVNGSDEPSGLWGRAFRPFFLGLAVYASIAIPLWAGIWLGAVAPPVWLQPMWWHGHEMIFGFVAAAIAGFLLTASAVWSGGPALRGRPLVGLFALWVAGRVAMAAAGTLPAWLVASVDVVFLPGVAGALLWTLWGTGQRRNQAIAIVLGVLAAANAAMHAEALGLVSGVAGLALRGSVDAVIVLLLVIAGRITPAFTRNALRMRGLSHPVRSWPGLDAAVIALAAALLLADLVRPHAPGTGAIALAVAAAAALRLVGWQSWHTRTDPLLWSLHAGSAWIVVGLVGVGAGDLGAPIPAASGLHALTAGAMGSSILAVITRVGLGHTGRPLALPRGVAWCYGLVAGGALLRVAAPFFGPDPQRALLACGAFLWALAFALFAIRYWPILVAPRPDGRPG